MKRVGLVFTAFCELVRYEVVVALLGSGRILSQLRQQSISTQSTSDDLEKTICDAVLLATCFYWKPVLCLQRAACTVRLLRSHGIHARLVIGYRPSPFFSHAWVEVNGRVVYGSVAYQKRLIPLHVA
jgi:Transglutaminase-like superfamily